MTPECHELAMALLAVTTTSDDFSASQAKFPKDLRLRLESAPFRQICRVWPVLRPDRSSTGPLAGTSRMPTVGGRVANDSSSGRGRSCQTPDHPASAARTAPG